MTKNAQATVHMLLLAYSSFILSASLSLSLCLTSFEELGDLAGELHMAGNCGQSPETDDILD